MTTGRKILAIAALTAITHLGSLTSANAWELQWFGHAAFKITSENDKVILIDPFIADNPLTPEKMKDLKKLGKVDLILVTHGHGDHLGDTAKIATLHNSKIGLNADMGQTLAALNIVPAEHLIRFNKSGSISPMDNIKITMVHAEHSSEVVHTDPKTKEQRVHPGGEPAGYIIELENGYTIYHAGDTGVFTDMQYIADYYQPDLALLPIGGHYTMNPEHAAYALKNHLQTKNVVPMHYGTFPALSGTPAQLKKALGKSSINIIEMKPGEIRKF